MFFTVPTDRVQLMLEVLSYMHHMQAVLPEGLAKRLSARYIPGASAAEASVAVRLLAIEPARLRQFESIMDAIGADIRRHDDERTIRLDNWPARWASQQSNLPIIYVAGPNEDQTIFVEFFSDVGDVPASIYHDHPGGRLFSVEHGIPT